MKKVICIVLLIAIIFTGCRTQPVDNPAVQTPTPSAATEETPGGTVTETADETETQTPTVENTPGQSETTATTETSTATADEASATPSATASATADKPTSTPTKTNKPTPTPTATVTPKIKTFSIPVSVAGGVKANVTKVNFKGYYKDNDEKSNTIIISQDATTSFMLTRSSSNWEISSEYSKYPTTLMRLKQQSGDLTTTVTVTFKAGTSVSADAISMAQFVCVPKNTVNNGLPTMLINVNSSEDYGNLITSDDRSVKDIWSEASYAIVEGKTKTYNMKDAQGTLKIKRRGFTSFDFAKKSYTVKLTDGKALLGMESNKDWVLAANYSDKSMLRNYFAYQLGQHMKTTWAPDCDFVEVYIVNGSFTNYLGTYLLVEKIEVSEEKVDIQEMTEEDDDIGTVTGTQKPEKILGGSFLVELESFDRASVGDMLIQTNRYQLSVKSPDKDYFVPSTNFDPANSRTWPEKHLATLHTRQAEYIRTFFNVVDEAIHTDNYAEFEQYIDVDSFVDYYIINELAKNIDGNLRLSTYFYKDKGGKLKVTIWDFDVAYGNCDYVDNGDSPTGFYIRTETSWYRHMFNTSEFRNKVRTRWNELRKGVLSDSNIASMLNKQAKVLEKSADANFERWPILGVQVWPNPSAIVKCDTYEENVEYLVDWLQERAAWLDNNIDRARV